MKIIQHVERPVAVQTIFVEAEVENLNCQYFIDKIEEALKLENNMTQLTNVKGKMTDWTTFLQDPILTELFWKFFTSLDYDFNYHIECNNAWGIKMEEGNYTKVHDHALSRWSSILYLTDSQTPIIFPELNKSIFPRKGLLLFFNGFLKHKTPRIKKGEVKYALPCNFNESIPPHYNKNLK